MDQRPLMAEPALDKVSASQAPSETPKWMLEAARLAMFGHDSQTLIYRLSSEEMLVPLRVFVGTWNLHGKEPPDSLAPWLPAPPLADQRSGGAGPGSPEMVDVYVIGTQEAERSIEKSVLNPSKAKWLLRLNAALGDQYACVASHSLVAIHLAVYVRVELLPEV